jgi:Raf kinase inhibitor-like YbhB/YbcL family protein
MGGIELRSPAFADRAPIPKRFSRLGGNVSPPLEWSGVPPAAVELVLLCEDPDAPSGTFVHWVVTGIDPGATGVAEGGTPQGGTAYRNGFGEQGWSGPQPPPGNPHRYLFRLFAVDEPVKLSAKPGAAEVHRAVAGRTLAEGVCVGTFRR